MFAKSKEERNHDKAKAQGNPIACFRCGNPGGTLRRVSAKSDPVQRYEHDSCRHAAILRVRPGA